MNHQSVNVASHLARLATTEPNRPALHYAPRGVRLHGETTYTTLTFAQLHTDSDALAHGLNAVGITRGNRVALMVPPSPDFFTLTFALLKIAAVPVLIDPGMGMAKLRRCLAEAEPEAFIGVRKAHFARRIFGWAKRTAKITLNVGRRRFFCHYSLAELRQKGQRRGRYEGPTVSPTEPAAILFTSGSTGVAKGAVYTHGIFTAQVELLRTIYGIEPGEVDFCTFPLFALFAPALGMTCVIPDMDAARPARIDPRKAVAQIKQFNVTNLFGSPAVIRRLGEWGSDNGVTLPTLRRAISAGAPATVSAIERFVKLLPESVQLFTPYGATEALPVTNIGSREILNETRYLTEQGKGVCVGRPVPGMEVRVIAISDEPIKEWDESLCLSPGQVGEIVVRGPVVTRQYFNRPEATKLAKIRDSRTGDVLHRMGDVGYLDEQGRLWFCGRKSQRVVTPHGTLFTDMVEPVFNTVEGVHRTALVGVTRDGVTYPVLCFERALSEANYASASVTALLALDEKTESHRYAGMKLEVLWYPRPFPVDVRHNSKIFREKLAVWADRKLGKRWNPKAHGWPSVGVGAQS